MIELIIVWIAITLAASTLMAFVGEKYGTGIIVGTFAGLIVTAQILANKQVAFLGFSVPAAVIAYATSFLLTDILCEFHGKDKAKQAVWSGFLVSILLVISLQVAFAWPGIYGTEGVLETALSNTWRIVAASLAAYVVSQNWDVWVFHKLKEKTGKKYLWLRNIASTTSSQFLDTIIFISIAFFGLFPILPLIIGQYVIKLVIAAMDTPFLYSIRWLKNLFRDG